MRPLVPPITGNQVIPGNVIIVNECNPHAHTSVGVHAWFERHASRTNARAVHGAHSPLLRAAVVLLGAGFDARFYRGGAARGGAALYEVDTPASQATKLRRLREAGAAAGSAPMWRGAGRAGTQRIRDSLAHAGRPRVLGGNNLFLSAKRTKRTQRTQRSAHSARSARSSRSARSA